MARRRKKPDQDAALASLESLLKEPPKSEKTPLQIFVEANYSKLIEAVNQGHSLTQIVAILRKQGISSTPKLLRAAIYQAAVENKLLDQLPDKLLPKIEENRDERPSEADLTSYLESEVAASIEEAEADPEAIEAEPISASTEDLRLPVPKTRSSKLAYQG